MLNAMRRSRSLVGHAGIGALIAAGVVMGSTALAQQGTGMRAVFGVNQGFSADSNRRLELSDPGRSLVSTTGLSFGLSSQTRNQQFSLQSGINARAFDIPGEGRGLRLDSPSLRASYRRDGARSGIALTADISRTPLRFDRPLDDFLVSLPVFDQDGLPILDDQGEQIVEDVIILPEDEDALIGLGRRTSIGLSGRIDLGRDGPIGSTITASRRDLRYSDAPTDRKSVV